MWREKKKFYPIANIESYNFRNYRKWRVIYNHGVFGIYLVYVVPSGVEWAKDSSVFMTSAKILI